MTERLIDGPGGYEPRARRPVQHATEKLGADKEVEADDAARVAFAEARNREDAATRPGGVAASVAAAARLNKQGV